LSDVKRRCLPHFGNRVTIAKSINVKGFANCGNNGRFAAFEEGKSAVKVLFVCHGNICRSPMAEFLLKDMVAKAGRS